MSDGNDLMLVLMQHQPYYDSFDQNSDSWGCTCNHQTGYRSNAEVFEKHIVPLVRRATAVTPDQLTPPLQRHRERHFWEDVQAHVNLLHKNKFDNSAQMLILYEQERRRQTTAIENLEAQLTRLANMSLSQEQLRGVLARAGMDLDVIIRSDEVFGEKPGQA